MKYIKKLLGKINVLMLACTMLSGCATILGGKITDCQTKKPAPGDPGRKVRAGFLVLDIVCGVVPVIVDFADHKIYKPCPDQKK